MRCFLHPPEEVAKIFVRILASDEFRGCFRILIFAIYEESKRRDTGNLVKFYEQLKNLTEILWFYHWIPMLPQTRVVIPPCEL